MLSAHSRLFSVPYESSLMDRSPAEADWFVRQFNRGAAGAGKARWVEKTPRHIHSIDRILRRFGDAKIVVMLRDGRDVACSLRERTGDLDRAVRRWLDDNAAAEPYFDHPAVHVMKYEDLITDRERELRRLLAFLDEEYEPALLAHHELPFRFYGRFERSRELADVIENLDEPPASVSGSDHRLHRSWQARQPVFDGRGRWRTALTAEERRRFVELAGDRLVAYGYTTDGDW